MKKTLVVLLVIVVIAVIAIQFVPVERTNPPVTAEIAADAQVMEVLKRSCYDCHSHETNWPWYSYVAPMSWLVARDVNEARMNVNFSTWGLLPEDVRSHSAEEIAEEAGHREMPLKNYLSLHPEAKLSDADIEALEGWSRSLKAEPSHPDADGDGDSHLDERQEEDGHHGASHSGDGDGDGLDEDDD